ncbi:hypothetical protein GYB59_16920 [bacterium]|nr:hypothetical protein [bacterium]
MSLGPLLPGRIPNSLLFTRSLQNLDRVSSEYLRLQDQISTGLKFQNIGENPSAAIQTIVLQQSLERNEQLQSNVETNRSLLTATEQALGDIGDVFNQMQTFILAGLGDGSSPSEKAQMANEVDTLIQHVVNISNSTFRGRYLFGGSQNTAAPFSISKTDQAVRFNGDLESISSYVSLDNLLGNNVSAGDTLRPLAEVDGTDIDPALAGSTKVSSLFGGDGVKLDVIEVTVDTGGGPQTERINLAGAQTINDLITRMEAPFAGDLTVAFDATGIQLTPAAGTVAVADVPGSRTAGKLGITSAAAAGITSTDLNPKLGLQTTLASLNGGTGIGPTAGTGLVITNGSRTSTVDLTGLTTVEDLFNAIKAVDPDTMTGFTEDGSGLKIASRLSGVGFSISENGGTNASLLGIRTFDTTTPLAELNQGEGVPVGTGNDLEITRRDGSTTNISLEGAKTVQDVLNLVNAVDPGVLTLSLQTTGNGFTISDSSGTGPLTIGATDTATKLGIAGSEDGNAELIGANVGAESAPDLLAGLNDGAGVPVGAGTLDITRRDGSVVNISLAGATTIQDVLNTVNAVDPGNLTLSLNASGGGFRLADNSGTGPLTVADNAVSTGLGINGTEDGVVPIDGTDPNQQRADGVIDLLFRLSTALRSGNNQSLEAIDRKLDAHLQEFNYQRGSVAGRLRSLDEYANSLADQDLVIQEAIVEVFHTDMPAAITEYTNLQVSIQATQQIAAQTLQLNLFNYL